MINKTNSETAVTEKIIVDAQTGAILLEETIDFNIADVYAENPNSNILETVQLPDLFGSGYLEGTYFTVFAPNLEDPRVFSENNIFQFSPNSSEAIEFDQVQTYFNASRVLKWFSENFDFSMEDIQMSIHVNDTINGRGDNALYIPPPNGPIIRLGAGQSGMSNLARDSDVVAHEFSHHVVFRRLKIMAGESGELHEGYADYFSYAINNDPYLGETILAGKPYLRTAKIDKDQGFYVRFDDPTTRQDKYFKAQVWSALLWDLRKENGSSFDELVYHSLNYIGAAAGYREALYGLLNADRDLNPLKESEAEYQIYGSNKCQIMNFAIKRGYAVYTEDLDGDSCGIDLELLGKKSREFTDEKENPVFDTKPFMPIKCGAITHASKNKIESLWLFLCIPLVAMLGRRRKNYGN